ncbi:MAG TPA: TolC family protein [Thermoanaerobaculaceae bacterium]|nr:TolC family protein [Thermoanaerobaculaceae bacterium]
MSERQPEPSQVGEWRLAPLTFAVLLLTVSTGMASGAWNTPPVPAGPNRPVELPAPPAPKGTPAPVIPEDLLKPGASLTLAQVVDIALQNNPETRTSYLLALSAAAQLGSKRAPYYPSVGVSASGTRTNQPQDATVTETQDIYAGAVGLAYLLLDMGGRSANVDDARFGLLAADWTHNATIQNVILAVETTYVQYVNAKAQIEAAQSTVKSAEAALEAATVRHDAGVGTIADVLQAKTALSQAQLSLQTFQGQVLVLRGELATAMGLPADTPYDVGVLPAEVPLDRGTEAADKLIATARLRRPDLAAARALTEKAEAHVRSVRSDGLPTLSLFADANRTYLSPAIPFDARNNWSASLLLTFPLFTGFANSYDIKKAKADAAVARSQADTLEQQVILEVWTSYYFLQTATQLVKTSRDLLASAEQSERVALGRYKEGVGTIIDLLTAQSALATARSQDILARSGWFIALAQLARDTGTTAPLDQPITVLKESRTQ